MNGKMLMTLAVCAAVVAGGISAAVVSFKRAEVARAEAETASALADAESAKVREADKVRDAEVERRRAAEAKEKAAADELKAQQEARLKAEAEAKAAAEDRQAKEAELAAAKARSAETLARRDAEAAKAQAATETRVAAEKTLAAETAKAQAAADALAAEKLRSEKVVAEAKLYELRKLDLMAIERNLSEWRRDLEEREQALRPEKTIDELSWAGGVEDSVIDGQGNVTKQVKEPYDPERDLSLPPETRRLARAERLRDEAFSAGAAKAREAVIASVERLYVDALRRGDVVNAAYYRQNILAICPDWKFKGEAAK